VSGSVVKGGRRLWRPDWTWRLRQSSCLVLVIWFGGLIPLFLVAAIFVGEGAAGAVFGAWVLSLVLFVSVVSVLDGRQKREWSRIADQRGWKVSSSAPELAGRWMFPPFSRAIDPDVVDVTTGRHRGRAFRTGMFRYSLGRTRPGFCFIELAIDRPLPPMQVAPESLTGLLAPGIRPLDLHLENADFNNRYRLVRGEPSLVHAVLNPRVMEAMLTVQPFGFVAHGEHFLLLAPGYRRPRTVLDQLDVGCDLLDLMPEHVWDAGADWRRQGSVT
jgi:hypothetical protein